MSKPEDKNSSVKSENIDPSVQSTESENYLDPENSETVDVDVDVQVEQGTADTSNESVDSLAVALEEVEKFKDMALRAEAEMENVRRRASRDVESAHKFGQEKLLQNLLPVVDSLEKAIESAEQATEEGANKAIAEGVSLCLKMLIDVLEKSGVSVVDPYGEPFDPNRHQALSVVENPDMEPNSVVAVIQKGYTLNDRLVRPAMVMVSKAAASNSD